MNNETLNKVMNAARTISEAANFDPFGRYLEIAEVIRHAEHLRRAERKLYTVLDRYTPRS